ncbi:MAG: hypothetical protein ACK4Y7_00225 [Caldimicrobium sp.]
MDKVAEKVNASGAKSPDEIVDFLRNNSNKKALHSSLKDEDIKQAFSKVKISPKADVLSSNKTIEKASNVTKKESTKTKRARKNSQKITNTNKKNN